MPTARFNLLLQEERFEEATALLQERLLAAELLDPANDETYVPYCDRIAYALLQKRGHEAFAAFWEGFLGFVRERLEPSFGEIHKGHLFFLLGVARLGTDLAGAMDCLARAVEEDRRAVARGWQARGAQADVDGIVSTFPGYITLVVAELVARSVPPGPERDRLCQGMVSLHFDVTWGPREADRARVREALATLAPPAFLERLRDLYAGLQAVHTQRLPAATLAMLEAVLGGLLYGLLEPGQDASAAGAAPAGLGYLLARADAGGLFPSETVRAACHLIRLVHGDVGRDGRPAQAHPVTPAVFAQVALLLKILFDLALIEWAESRQS